MRLQRAKPGLTTIADLLECADGLRAAKAAEAFGRGDSQRPAVRQLYHVKPPLPRRPALYPAAGGRVIGAGIDADYAATARATAAQARREARGAIRYSARDFFDHDAGSLYLYTDDAGEALYPTKGDLRRAIPSGNSIFQRVLAELYKRTKDEKWRWAYIKQLGFICSAAARYPLACAFALRYKTSVKLLDIRY